MSAQAARRSAAAASSVIAPPTLQAAFWMILLLIPLAALFSAVCVSLAVLARSMKEGQYYMTPLYLVCMPLVFVTLMPGVELDLFYSLVPITGVALLLRALILGNYDVALRFFLPVLVPTLVYAAVALRWAVDQFQREDVLFRESEQFSLSAWLRHVLRDREPLPTGRPGGLVLRPDPDLDVVLDALPGAAGAGPGAGQRGRGSVDHLASAGDHGVLADVGPEEDVAAGLAREALPRAGGRAGRGTQSAGQRAAADRRVALSDFVGHQDDAGADHVSVAGALDLGFDLRLDSGGLRGVRVSRFYSFGARASAPDAVGHLAFGLDVWFSARALEPFPAALQRDAPGGRAGSAGRAEPEHTAGDRLSFLEQRLGGRARLRGSRTLGGAHRALDLSQPGGRALS